MTASLFVTGTHATAVARHVAAEESVVHAVARPTVDGLESSVCGLLVRATATDDWLADRDGPRCPECSRIAG